MPIKQLWFNYRLECIEAFLSRAFQVHDKYTAALAPPETEDELDLYPRSDAELDHAFDILSGYQDIVFRAVFLELNALVERELKSVAKKVLATKGEKHPKLNRGNIRPIIEQAYRITLEDFPRFDEVDAVRRISNAYKHEDGFSGEYEEVASRAALLFGYREIRYKLTWDKAYQSIQAVREFLLALPGDREELPEIRVKPEDEKTKRERQRAWELLRTSGALGHDLQICVPATDEQGGYSAICRLCGKSFWAEDEEMIHILALLDRGNCPGIIEGK